MSIRAETVKLTRQRAALFWGFLLVPAFTLFVSLVLVDAGPPPGAGTVQPIQPLHSAVRALAVGGNPIAQLFYAVGAAGIFAVEYRYSGWRHLVPRARRSILLLSKFATFALFAAASLLLVALGNLLATTLLPLVLGRTPTVTDLTVASGGLVLASFLVSLLELATLGGLVAVVAVATRSTMGAIIAPFLLSLAASMAESYLSGLGGAAIPLPTFAADALRLWLASTTPSPELSRSGALALVTLLGWASVSMAMTIAIFSRQDLVSE